MNHFTLGQMAELLETPGAAIVVPLVFSDLKTGEVFWHQGKWLRFISATSFKRSKNAGVTVYDLDDMKMENKLIIEMPFGAVVLKMIVQSTAGKS